ncbi:MAG: hypothetical protein ACLGIK_14850, partial [Gemmatimonadota bacterium]
MPARILPAVVSFFVLSLASRSMDPAQVGVFGMALLGATLASSVMGGWLDQAAHQLIPRKISAGASGVIAAHMKVLLSILLALGAASSVLLAGVAALAVDALAITGVTAALCLSLVASNGLQAMNLAHGRPRQFLLAEVVRS